MNYINKLYANVVKGKEKAIAAFVVAAVGSFLSRHGLKFDVNALSYLQAVVIGLIGHIAVYFTSNKAA